MIELNTKSHLKHDIKDSVWYYVRYNFSGNVRDKVRYKVWDNVWINVRRNDSDNVWDNVKLDLKNHTKQI